MQVQSQKAEIFQISEGYITNQKIISSIESFACFLHKIHLGFSLCLPVVQSGCFES